MVCRQSVRLSANARMRFTPSSRIFHRQGIGKAAKPGAWKSRPVRRQPSRAPKAARQRWNSCRSPCRPFSCRSAFSRSSSHKTRRRVSGRKCPQWRSALPPARPCAVHKGFAHDLHGFLVHGQRLSWPQTAAACSGAEVAWLWQAAIAFITRPWGPLHSRCGSPSSRRFC